MFIRCAFCGDAAVSDESDASCQTCGAPRASEPPLGDQLEVGLFGYVWKAPPPRADVPTEAP